MYASFGKRSFDIAISALGLLFLSPLLIVISILLYASQGGPVFFRQIRPGRHGVPFTLVKFRTMNDTRDASGELLPDRHRITRVGAWVRRTSVDELPELWNVLVGEMSLVGPRPLLCEYLDRYTSEQQRRHEVRPGITGLAQTSGRQMLPFSRRLELDVEYVDNLSIRLDARILLATAGQIVFSSGVKVGQEVSEVDDIGLSKGGDKQQPTL